MLYGVSGNLSIKEALEVMTMYLPDWNDASLLLTFQRDLNGSNDVPRRLSKFDSIAVMLTAAADVKTGTQTMQQYFSTRMGTINNAKISAAQTVIFVGAVFSQAPSPVTTQFRYTNQSAISFLSLLPNVISNPGSTMLGVTTNMIGAVSTTPRSWAGRLMMLNP